MSDSFADLWSASAPPKPKAQPLASAISSSFNPNKPHTSARPDVFALLANSGSGTSTPRYGTGLGGSGSTPGSRSITPSVSNLSSSARTTPQPQTMAKPGGGGATDAFGDLFSSSSSKSSANMTLAARLAMESQRGGSSQRVHGGGTTAANTTTSAGFSAWAGLDTLAGGLAPTAAAAANEVQHTKVKIDDVDDWGLSDFGSNIRAAQDSSLTDDNTNGTGSARPKPRTTASLWDLDDFSSVTDSVRSQSDVTTGHHSDRATHEENITSPDEEFDFGHREDRVDEERWEHRTMGANLLDAFENDHDVLRGGETIHGLLDPDGHHRDEDDVLGLLSKPVEAVRKRHTPSPEPTGQRPLPPTSAPKPPSPPPHILGQIVEMGFSVQQARIALAQTSTGLDVPAAIESLINSNRSSPAPSLPNATQYSRDPPRAEVPPPHPRGAPKGQKERERERLERQRVATAGEGPSQTPTVADIQEQADKLLAQASEIGLSVFSKASAMWGKGKEKVVKAYEERTGTVSPFGDGSNSRGSGLGRGRGGPGRVADGRPKWMQEAVEEYGEDKHHQDGFKDDHVVFEAFDDESPSSRTKQARPVQVVEPAHHEEDVDLFSNTPVVPRAQQAAAATMPPPSRTIPHPRRPPPTLQSSTASSSHSVASPPRTMTPPPERKLPIATPAALATALKHKITGTEQFKLGQYAAAVDAYSSAILALPRGHLLLVPLYTNRALSRIRCGEYKAAEDDCARALGVIFDDGVANTEDDFGANATVVREGKSLVWSPSALPPSLLQSASQTGQAAWAHPQGHGVDLAEGYTKALRRRAEALEGREKWAAAAGDWEVLAGCAWTSESVRRDAVRGRGRCKGMDGTNANRGSTTATATTSSRPNPTPAAPKPKPRPTEKPSAPAAPSEALRALQSQNAQAEAEESLKYSLKDRVDARLAAWRQGREGNIRALLVGLDGVLWEGALEGVRVRGLHELVSAAQVKKGYVRAIGRVHPDKLNAGNSTVEQRMLANGVFGTLNEAWIAFQAMQK